MGKPFQFSPSQKEAIVDALEMRVKECQNLTKQFSDKSEMDKRLALTFKAIGEKAEATLAAIERAEAEEQW